MSICSLSFVKISTSDPKKNPPSLAPRGVEISHQLTQQGMFLHQAPLHRFHHLQEAPRKPPGWEPGGSTVSWDGPVPNLPESSDALELGGMANFVPFPTCQKSRKVGKRKNALATMSDPIFPDSRFLTWTTNWPKQRPSSSFKNPIWLSSGLSSLTGNAVSASR